MPDIKNPFTRATLRMDEELDKVKQRAEKQRVEPFMTQKASPSQHRAMLKEMTPQGFRTEWSSYTRDRKEQLLKTMKPSGILDIVRGDRNEA